MCDKGVYNPNFIAMIYRFKDIVSWNSAHYLCCLLSFFLVSALSVFFFFFVLSNKKSPKIWTDKCLIAACLNVVYNSNSKLFFIQPNNTMLQLLVA